MTSLHRTTLSPGRTVAVLAAIAGGLVLLHVLAMQLFMNDDLSFTNSWTWEYWHIAMLDLDEEEGFGTWFGAMVLLYIGRLLVAQRSASKESGDGLHVWWLVLAIGFHVLSIDEVAGMHEYLNSILDESTESGVWTDVALVGLGVVAVAYVPFLVRLPRRTAALFVVAGLLYAGGAVGVERWTGSDVNSLSYNMWTAFEEGLEMAGAILMVYAVLDHLRSGARNSLQLELSRTTA